MNRFDASKLYQNLMFHTGTQFDHWRDSNHDPFSPKRALFDVVSYCFNFARTTLSGHLFTNCSLLILALIYNQYDYACAKGNNELHKKGGDLHIGTSNTADPGSNLGK